MKFFLRLTLHKMSNVRIVHACYVLAAIVSTSLLPSLYETFVKICFKVSFKKFRLLNNFDQKFLIFFLPLSSMIFRQRMPTYFFSKITLFSRTGFWCSLLTVFFGVEPSILEFFQDLILNMLLKIII